MPAGRPLKFDPKVVLPKIFERMRLGESTRAICRSEGMPSWSEFMTWIAEASDEIKDHYAQARECMVDAWVIDAYDTAHDESRDYQTVIETIEAPGGVTIKSKRISDNSASMRDRLKVDTILKIAGKLFPKKYGERVTNEMLGANGESLSIVVNVNEKQAKKD